MIWQHALPAGLHDWFEQTDAANLPHIRILVEPGNPWSALEPLLDECDLLTDDIGGLGSAFADITGIGRVDVRLERINHDSCWRFHRDTVETRLVTTYRGPATEWVQPVDADRAICEQGSTTARWKVSATTTSPSSTASGRALSVGSSTVRRPSPGRVLRDCYFVSIKGRWCDGAVGQSLRPTTALRPLRVQNFIKRRNEYPLFVEGA